MIDKKKSFRLLSMIGDEYCGVMKHHAELGILLSLF